MFLAVDMIDSQKVFISKDKYIDGLSFLQDIFSGRIITKESY